jgi:nitrogen fixation protein NifU and related proteins
MGSYSEVLMDHFNNPRNEGSMQAPDRIGLVGTPGNGAFMVLCLRLREGRVAEARFQTYGCGASIAAGSLLTEMITDRSVAECLSLTVEQLIDELGGVPPHKLHAPALAIGALRIALQAPAREGEPDKL